ncbi:MAG: hypothetical protein IJQ45_02685 [Clostridia bacterium]|nr:hypothetical protein [Clostridia bacterium]
MINRQNIENARDVLTSIEEDMGNLGCDLDSAFMNVDEWECEAYTLDALRTARAIRRGMEEIENALLS